MGSGSEGMSFHDRWEEYTDKMKKAPADFFPWRDFEVGVNPDGMVVMPKGTDKVKLALTNDGAVFTEESRDNHAVRDELACAIKKVAPTLEGVHMTRTMNVARQFVCNAYYSGYPTSPKDLWNVTFNFGGLDHLEMREPFYDFVRQSFGRQSQLSQSTLSHLVKPALLMKKRKTGKSPWSSGDENFSVFLEYSHRAPQDERRSRKRSLFLNDLPVKNLRPEDVVAAMKRQIDEYFRRVAEA